VRSRSPRPSRPELAPKSAIRRNVSAPAVST
jgi:hypothetical protein